MPSLDRNRFRSFIESIQQDGRFAARTLRKSPTYTITTVLVLALAIGANAAMFSLIDAVLLRPLPYPSPHELVTIWTDPPGQSRHQGRTAFGSFDEWQRHSHLLAELAVFDPTSMTLTTADGAERISGARVSPSFFQLFGVRPVYGRLFSDDDAAQRLRLAVVSHRFWSARLGGSSAALGASINVDGEPYRVVGVLPPQSSTDTDIWIAHTLTPDWEKQRAALGSGSWFVYGRLRPNATPEQAQAELNGMARETGGAPGARQSAAVSVVPLAAQITGPTARVTLWTLMTAVFFVLLIAATNIASLTLARNAGRAREMAVRAALGASRARLARQLLAESLVLALCAGIVGLAFAAAGMQLVLAFKPAELVVLNDVSLDPRVLAFGAALCFITAGLVALAPALTVTRQPLRSVIGDGARGASGGPAAHRMRRVLVAGEVALAIVLLVGAGLLIRSLWSIQNVRLGFEADRVLSLQLATAPSLRSADRADFYNRVLERTSAVAGVERAAIVGEILAINNPEREITAETSSGITSMRLKIRLDEASDGFFQTVRVPLVSGRGFSASDGAGSAPAAIVNAAMARKLWPGEQAVGRRFKLGAASSSAAWRTVIGVVGDMRRTGLETEPIAQVFEPLAQNPSGHAVLLLRTRGDDPLKVANAARDAIRTVDKGALVYGMATLEGQLDGLLTQRRFETWLLIAFSVIALVMAAIGIFGLIQYSVQSRTREIGIRLAIGADGPEIFGMIIGEGLRLSVVGLSLGIVLSAAMVKGISSLLYDVTAHDPLTFAAVCLLLIAVAIAACYIPARRAMQVDPAVALRCD